MRNFLGFAEKRMRKLASNALQKVGGRFPKTISTAAFDLLNYSDILTDKRAGVEAY